MCKKYLYLDWILYGIVFCFYSFVFCRKFFFFCLEKYVNKYIGLFLDWFDWIYIYIFILILLNIYWLYLKKCLFIFFYWFDWKNKLKLILIYDNCVDLECFNVEYFRLEVN